MTNKILIIGPGDPGLHALALASIKERYGGGDIILVTPNEAKEHRLTMNDFANKQAREIIESSIIPSGNRKERRAKKRRTKKKYRQ